MAGDGLKTTARAAIAVDPHTLQTSLPYVFAAGDAVSGPATVIEAVAAGHRAVEAIDRFLRQSGPGGHGGRGRGAPPPGEDWAEIPRDIGRQERVRSRHLDADDACGRVCGGGPQLRRRPRPGARPAAASTAASAASAWSACGPARPRPSTTACRAEELQVKVGSIILATGYDLMDPSPMRQFGYGLYPNVFTSLEFERLSNATGPTGGRILIRDEDGRFTRTPQSVAILHCVGSRDVNYHEYCSRVCCMYALKYTHLIKEKVGHDTRVYDFYIDQRCYGKGYEEFYRRCQEEGTVFIRGKVAEITDQAASAEEQGKLVAVAEDTLSRHALRRAGGHGGPVRGHGVARRTRPTSGGSSASTRARTASSWRSTPSWAPLNTATDGVFLAGACQGPKDIPDTVAQASGAAAKSLLAGQPGQGA
ncbi:MAG: hypothetical protein MZU91_14670 [Desulfosudis oleivorans]|nr:hypothetical protein [Desulfosudis oleivorans]